MARWALLLTLAGFLCTIGSIGATARASDGGDDDLPDGYVDTPGTAARVAVVGNLAYVADRLAGLQIVDISDPTRPRIIGSVETGDANGVVVSGRWAYVADGWNGMTVVDVGTPTAPRVVATPNLCSSYGIAYSRHYVYLAVFGGLQVFDVHEPTLPAYVGDVDWYGATYGVVVVEPYAYFADRKFGLQVFDVSNPELPVLVRTVDTPGQPRDLTIAGDHAFVADSHGGLQVVDITVPTEAFLAGGSATSSDALGVTISGYSAYVATGSDGIAVFDISDPTRPARRADIPTAGEAACILSRDSDLFVADGENGLLVLAQQAQPNRLPNCEPGGPYFGTVGSQISLRGQRSRDPDGTIQKYQWDFGDNTYAEGANPRHVYRAPGVYVAQLCLTDDDGEVSCCGTTVDLTEPTAVTLTLDATSSEMGVLLAWEIAQAERVRGFEVERRGVDGEFAPLTTELLPSRASGRQRFEYDDRTALPGMTYIYRLAALEPNGERTVAEREVHVPEALGTRFVLHPNAPNPFNPTTRIAFDVPHRARVTLGVYDVSGRLVRMLVDGELGRERHSVTWDGRDNAGHPSRSGIYLLRLQSGGQAQSRKIVLAG